MEDIQTGGPAFPAFEVRTHDTGDLVENASQGMTLRDYFAAKAMQGIIAGKLPLVKGADAQNDIAKAAYKAADAMLKARAA